MTEQDETALVALAERCREELVAHVASIDSQTLERLAQARHRALTDGRTMGGERPFRVPGGWLPVSVFALAGTLVLAVWIFRPVVVNAPGAEVAPVEDVEMLAASDEPDFYTEDAAFYEWAGNIAGES